MDFLNQIPVWINYVVGVLVALLALDNAVDAIAKAFGNKEIDTFCGVFALKLNDWINKFKNTPPPLPPKAGVLVILFILLVSPCFAQTTTQPAPINVNSIFNEIPNLKQGVAYDIPSGNAAYFTTADLLDYAGFSLSAGYLSSSGIVGSIDYDIGGLSKLGINVAILSAVDLRVGFMVGIDDISTATTSGTAERNKLVYGPEVTIVSLKF